MGFDVSKMTLRATQRLLDETCQRRNNPSELTYERPDPLLVASRYQDERIMLICALFGYGSARQIVAFLDSLDFGLLEADEVTIRQSLATHRYRFQTQEDIAALFIALRRLGPSGVLESIFLGGYKQGGLLAGLWRMIDAIRSSYAVETYGYRFLVGSVPARPAQAGTFKRYLMFLRWMVRSDAIDPGLWRGVHTRDLIMPLDVHTANTSRKLGLLKRKSHDMKAAIELTERLRCFDPEDPVRYDFALYRLGQERLV
jgi:uncharacterized protein (TIGR02757 family)